MANNVYKQVELTGTSNTTIEEAVQNAISKASQTTRNMRWFEVVETRGRIENGLIAQWQITMKVGYTLED